MSKGFLNVEDAGFTVGVNVKIIQRDKKTGRVIAEREGHNTCLRTQLLGIVKFLNGEYNESQPQVSYYDWIPRYLGVGTNNATYSSSESVKSEVNINDTRLLSEISPRMKLPERNKIINKTSQRYVQLIINCYLPSEYYNGEVISEAGLFSGETGNNCLFRIVFDGITKNEDSVVEVNWVISVISIQSEGQPYEELNKDDLVEVMKETMDTLLKYEPGNTKLQKLVDDYKNIGIYYLQREDIKQTELDEKATAVLGQDLKDLIDSNEKLK